MVEAWRERSALMLVVGLRQVRIPFDGRATSSSASCIATSSSLMNCATCSRVRRRRRDVALFDLVVDAREGERELVVRERDVREVRVDPGEVSGSMWMLSWRSLGSFVHAAYDTRARGGRRSHSAAIAGSRRRGVVLFGAGRSVSTAFSTRRWHRRASTVRSSPHRSRARSTPPGTGGRALDDRRSCSRAWLSLVLRGAASSRRSRRSVTGGAWREKERRKMIDQLRDHIIICGYGRVGRRAARGVPRGGGAVRRARLQRRRARTRRGSRAISTSRETAPRTRISTRPGSTRARGLVASSDSDARQPLHHALGTVAAARADDRRARRPTRTRSEAQARRRGPRRHAVLDRGTRDGEAHDQAAGDGVPQRRHDAPRAPTSCFEEIEVHVELRRGRADDPRAARPRRDRREHRRDPQARTGRSTRRRRRTTRIESRRRADRRRHARARSGGSKSSSRRARPLRVTPSRASPRAIAEVAGAEVELERPSDPAHGDYATNVALRLGGASGRAPRELAEELAEKVARAAEVERAEVAGPGFLNLCVGDAFLATALARDRRGLRRAARRKAGARERRDGLGEPNGADPRVGARNGAYGDSVARLLEFAGHEVDARVLLQRRRPADRPLPRVGRGRCAAARNCRRTGTRATTSPSSRSSKATPCRTCSRSIERDDGALPHPLRLVGAAERARAAAARVPAAARHVREGRRACGCARRPTATTRTG